MSKQDDGGPAFPCNEIIRRNDKGGLHGPEISTPGMSMRDAFAIAALQGLMSNSGGPCQARADFGWGLVNCRAKDVADMAYDIADEMLRARQS